MGPPFRRRPFACLICQSRAFITTSSARLAGQKHPQPPTRAPNPDPTKHAAHPLKDVPRWYGERVEHFSPQPLMRPIGTNAPPKAGENTGKETRSFRQRHEDFVNYQKHLERREQLKEKMARPYFRDFTNLQHHEGKLFIAPPRMFRSDLSLYFPNLHGQTLEKKNSKNKDTTPLLSGKASVVSLFSSMWGQKQAESFVSKEANPRLHEAIRKSSGKAQFVQINVEQDFLKALIIKLFKWSLRKSLAKENWNKYFIVQKGISDELRESIGLFNSKVGYTYLVDAQCKIRWAGSGDSHEVERESLAKAVERLVKEVEGEKTARVGSQRQPVTPKLRGSR